MILLGSLVALPLLAGAWAMIVTRLTFPRDAYIALAVVVVLGGLLSFAFPEPYVALAYIERVLGARVSLYRTARRTTFRILDPNRAIPRSNSAGTSQLAC